MESHAKLLGHPIHQMLIVFPVGLLLTSVIFDILFWATADSRFSENAFYLISIGVIAGGVAAIFGFIDWLALPSRTRAKSVGAAHGLGNVIVLVLFSLSLLLRSNQPSHIPAAPAVLLSAAGLVILMITAWLGGELVTRLGVGVDPGANLDAPNSLKTKPAHRHF